MPTYVYRQGRAASLQNSAVDALHQINCDAYGKHSSGLSYEFISEPKVQGHKISPHAEPTHISAGVLGRRLDAAPESLSQFQTFQTRQWSKDFLKISDFIEFIFEADSVLGSRSSNRTQMQWEHEWGIFNWFEHCIDCKVHWFPSCWSLCCVLQPLAALWFTVTVSRRRGCEPPSHWLGTGLVWPSVSPRSTFCICIQNLDPADSETANFCIFLHIFAYFRIGSLDYIYIFTFFFFQGFLHIFFAYFLHISCKKNCIFFCIICF